MPTKDFRFGISGSVAGVDLNRLLIEHAPSSFFMRVADELPELELHSNDVLIVDRALQPKKSDVIIIATNDDPELHIARFDHVTGPYQLWGVVSKVIRDLRS